MNDTNLKYKATTGSSTPYPLHEAVLSVSLLNFDPLEELGISITESEHSSENWADNVAGFSIPAPYAGAGFENLTEIEFSGSSLSALINKIIVKDDMSSEERKGVEIFLNELSSIKCAIGYIDIIDKSGITN